MEDDLAKIAVVALICAVVGISISQFAGCERERQKAYIERDKWMMTCVERGGKIAKEVVSTNGFQYAYDTCLMDKK